MRFTLGRHAIVAASLLLCGMAAAPAGAADAPAPVTILVVDTQRVMGESKAGKAIQQQVQARVQSYQQGITKQEQALATAQQDLQKQQTILQQDAFSAKVKEFETRFNDERRKAQEQQREIVAGENEARGKQQVAMVQIIADLTKERGANLVLDKAAVLLFDTHFDVTDEVIKRLDEKMPTFQVSFPAGGGAAVAPTAAPTQGVKKPAPKKN